MFVLAPFPYCPSEVNPWNCAEHSICLELKESSVFVYDTWCYPLVPNMHINTCVHIQHIHTLNSHTSTHIQEALTLLPEWNLVFFLFIIFKLMSYVNFIQRMFQIVNNWTLYLNLNKWSKDHSAIISGCITPVRNAPFFSLHLDFSFLSLLPVVQLGFNSQSPPSFGERP